MLSREDKKKLIEMQRELGEALNSFCDLYDLAIEHKIGHEDTKKLLTVGDMLYKLNDRLENFILDDIQTRLQSNN